jgi:hypothetical protein
MKRTFEMFAVDFFLQLGPDFRDYAEVFVKNGFNDVHVETICTMHIQEDLDTMPLGHRRKIETAVKNMKSAIDTGSHEHHLPIVEEKVQNVEMKSSSVKNERKQTRRNFQTRSKAGIGFIQTKGYGQICTYARTRWAI